MALDLFQLLVIEWPFPALALGLLGVAWVLYNLSRVHHTSQRTTYYWWLPLFFYMIHQFEEHGIDVYGNKYAFKGQLCALLEKTTTEKRECAASEWIIMIVNCGTVWIMLTLVALLQSRTRRTFTLLKASGIGSILVNAWKHIVEVPTTGWTYNSGLVTGVTMFLPLALFLMYLEIKENGGFSNVSYVLKVIFWSGVMGFLSHAVLIGSLVMAMQGHFQHVNQEAVLTWIQLLNGVIPLLGDVVLGSYPSNEKEKELQKNK
ncbi:hypothetical protein C9374_014650 [Naegleria lovaniensis]|uniref:Uncharacterized protein n=1 Tax=Naegleria lovaniensis TaxID=51637 RepID=A0AA88GY91_NAELO|nr:uncharacterized protein C9374_014650 [Naegleria lovaniensis]KAG2389250.1 hypothetical protein C9374_014650 [Naegleria lovaniensis]